MKIDTQLFIGGKADGRRIKTDGQPVVIVPTIPKYAAAMPDEPVPLHSHQETEEYVREKMRCGEREDVTDFIFYRHTDMKLKHAVSALFQHYNPKR